MKKKRTQAQIPATTIIEREELATEYPRCVLPPHFFERAVYLAKRREESGLNKPRSIFSVVTWDGREVMEVTSD